MKSIFGFKVLDSWQSILSTYFFIILQHILSPMFGISNIELLAGRFFNFLISLSIIILIFNSFYQKEKSLRYVWIIAIIPILITLPKYINIMFSELKQIILLVI